MSSLLVLVVSGLSALLQFVSSLNIGIYSWLGFYQPKTPKSLLK